METTFTSFRYDVTAVADIPSAHQLLRLFGCRKDFESTKVVEVLLSQYSFNDAA
jgi:hypothetical protein